MRFLRSASTVSLLLLVIIAFTGCPPQPLSLVTVTPNLGLYRVTGDMVVKATFNQPVDPASVNSTTFFITQGEQEGSPPVAGTLSVSKIFVTFTPTEHFKFGVHYRIWITSGVMSTQGLAFNGVFPATTYGKTSEPAPGYIFVVNKPNDMDDQEIGGRANELVGYNPLAPELYNPALPEQCPGISATEGWKFTTGRPDVLVAVIDNGLENYTSNDLQRSLFLNRGELPLPRNAQGKSKCDLGPCKDPYDWNGDGRFNVFDYAEAGYAFDPSGVLSPVSDLNGNGRIDVADLIQAFSDGADGYAADPDASSDANNLADDISGYDFIRKVPLALGMADYPEGTHGEGRAEEIAAQADNNDGTPGVCPDCTVVVIRITYALIEEGELVAHAIRYALGLGADAIVAALGTLNGTSEEVAAIDEAHALGVPVITGPGDESSFHHSAPSIMNHLYTVKGNVGSFTESFCTGYGGQIHTSAVGECGSTASGRSAGAVGLVISRARELGYCATSDPTNPNCVKPDLTANEVKQVLSKTAEKPSVLSACSGLLTDAPCKLDTWDRHQGYGRINLFKAMIYLEQKPIPPAVEILYPYWFSYFDLATTPNLTLTGTASSRAPIDSMLCTFAPGIEPDEVDFMPFACTPDEHGNWSGELSLNDVAAALGGVSGPPSGPEGHTFTVRVRATSGEATGEDRRAFAVHSDPDLVPGFPFSLADLNGDGVEEITMDARNAPSIEASPALADLDGDGKDEIILVTSNSFLHVLSYDTGLQRVQELPGYPIAIQRLPGQNDGISGAPAVGDIDLDGDLDIVVATIGGYVFAFRGYDGMPLVGSDGLIGQADTPANGSPEQWGAGNSFFSGPVLADLNGDGYLDVVVGCGDQKVYAFSGASVAASAPARLDGWPVRAADPAHCTTLANSILGTVAAVDITGDNIPEILAGTSETCDSPTVNGGRLYAIHPDGTLHPGGPFVQGFPVNVESNFLQINIPLPPLTTGIPGAPVAAKSGDKVVIGTGAFLGPTTYVKVNTTTGQVSVKSLEYSVQYVAGASGAFGADALGNKTYAVGTAGLGPAQGHGLAQIEHHTVVWTVNETPSAQNFPNEDFMFLSNPGYADVNGDGTPELITVSGGHLIHAFVNPTTEAVGWPKFTYGWQMASPALGDLNGDGLMEIVAPVREGRVFAWRTAGPLCGDHPWPTFHHDNHRTGNFDEPIADPRCP